MSELLSISIPTRNRAPYLQELLQSIEPQLEADENLREFVRVYVFDNASTDNTPEIVKKSRLNIVYKRNAQNIGGDPNILQAFTSVSGKYVWVIGDDEFLPMDAIRLILEKIRTHNLHLFINTSHGYKPFVKLPLLFSSYSDFVHYVEKRNPHLLIAHSLISANVILRCCFYKEFALNKIDTHYGHFYGITRGLKNFPGGVFIPAEETLIVRPERAAPVDGIWPEALEEDQAQYLEWLVEEYDLKNVVPRRVVSDYRQRLILASKPKLTVRGFTLHLIHSAYNEMCSSIPICRPILQATKALYKRIKGQIFAPDQ